MTWRNGVVYQIYPRSFQDSDGDGVGDLAGIRSRLDYLQWLGVDAIWLSPIFQSPMADHGYDVSDYEGIDPVFGTLADFDALLDDAHARGLRVLLDFVPCHTSIEHRWFRDHPDWYIWADGRGGGPPNNWVSAFGGSAWTYHEGRGQWYLHSFYPEQPDLDWRNPDAAAAMAGVLRLWRSRGVDGFRIDAVERLMKDPKLRDDPPRTQPFGLPLVPHERHLGLTHSRNGPGTGEALAGVRAAVGDAFLVAEIYMPSARVGPYLDHVDRFFAFEMLFAEWDARAVRHAIEAALAACRREGTAPAWVLSNHDFGRFATRYGSHNARAALELLLTLPGTAVLYQGDELALPDGHGHPERTFDRAGRDGFRHPMQWDASEHAGFTTGEPWLPSSGPRGLNVEDERADPASTLRFCREMIARRAELGDGFEFCDGESDSVLAYRRGDRVVAIDIGS
jgi:alpha-glucosidase